MRLLPGVPRSRIYRIVRKGEVRVNGKRAGPSMRLQAERQRARAAGARRSRAGTAAARVRSAVLEAHPGRHHQRGRAAARARQARRHRRARRQRPELRRHRGAARAAARGRRSSSCIGSIATPAAACSSRASAARCARCTSCCAKGGSRSAISRCVKGHWDLGHKRIDVPLRTDTRVGGERTVGARVAARKR